jgi:hypothetical protein
LLKFSLVAEKNWKEQERQILVDGTFYLVSENGLSIWFLIAALFWHGI